MKLDRCYMNCAVEYSKLSHAKRNKVGAVLVTKSGVVLGGVNGLPKQLGNTLEENGATKPEVIHAELNCILKAAKEGVSVVGSTLYTTLAPCSSCASMLLAAGVDRVVYKEKYRISSGLEILKENIIVDCFGGDGED